MSVDNLEDTMKIIIVGDGNVGKTTMLRRYVKGTYSEQYKKTIGADYLEKSVYLKDLKQEVMLMLWDTAGQEVFNALTATYYRNAAACVLCFSTIDRDSFQNVINWKKKVEAQCGEGAMVMVLCQTKCDLSNEAAMTHAEGDQLAAHLRLPFFRVSTKEDVNVSQLFEFTAKQCVLRGMGGGDMGGNSAGGGLPRESDGGVNQQKSSAGGAPSASSAGGGAAAPTSSGTSAPSAASAAAAGESTSSEKDGGGDGKKDKKDKKDTKDKDKGGDDSKDKAGNNTKPIQMKELKKKDKKDKKKGGGGCVV